MVSAQTTGGLHEAGKKLVRRVVVIVMSLSVVTVATFLLDQGAIRLPQQLVRLALTALLCMGLVRGATWARWTSAVLFLLGGLLSVGGAARLLSTPSSAWLMLGLGALYLYCAGVLITSRSVSAFFSPGPRSAE